MITTKIYVLDHGAIPGKPEPTPPPQPPKKIARKTRFARWFRKQWHDKILYGLAVGFIALGICVFIAAIEASFAWAVWYFWNHVLTANLGWRELSYVSALSIVLIVSLLGSTTSQWGRRSS